jgi:hypothetical protein
MQHTSRMPISWSARIYSITRLGLRGRWNTAGRRWADFDVTIVQLPEPIDALRRALDTARGLGVRRVLCMLLEHDRAVTLCRLDEPTPLVHRRERSICIPRKTAAAPIRGCSPTSALPL